MGKRKAGSDLIDASLEELTGTKGSRIEVPVHSALGIALVEPTGRTNLRGISVNPNRPGVFTCASGISHVLTTGVPTEQLGIVSTLSAAGVTQVSLTSSSVIALTSLTDGASQLTATGVRTGPMGTVPASTDEREDTTSNWFWGLLQTAGYEVW